MKRQVMSRGTLSRQKNVWLRRTLAVLLSLCMVLTLIPVTVVSAADSGNSVSPGISVAADPDSKHSYTVKLLDEGGGAKNINPWYADEHKNCDKDDHEESEQYDVGEYPTVDLGTITHADVTGGENETLSTSAKRLSIENKGSEPIILTASGAYKDYFTLTWKNCGTNKESTTWLELCENNGDENDNDKGTLTITPNKNAPPTGSDGKELMLTVMEQNSRRGWGLKVQLTVIAPSVNVTVNDAQKVYGQTFTEDDILCDVNENNRPKRAAELGLEVACSGFSSYATPGIYDYTVSDASLSDYDVNVTGQGRLTVVKAEPKAVGTPVASICTGETLTGEKIIGTYENPYNGEQVQGSFEITDDVKSWSLDNEDVGRTETITCKFVPSDMSKYEVVDNVPVKVNILPKEAPMLRADKEQLSVEYDGNPHPVEFTVNGDQNAVPTVEYNYNTGNNERPNWKVEAPTAAGTYDVRAHVGEGNTYDAGDLTVTMVIKPKEVKVKFISEGAIVNRPYAAGQTKAYLNIDGHDSSNYLKISSGLVETDENKVNVDYDKVEACYNDSYLGENKPVTVMLPENALAGAGSENYYLAPQTFHTTGDIFPRKVTVSLAKNLSKEYGQEMFFADKDLTVDNLDEDESASIDANEFNVDLVSDGIAPTANVGIYSVSLKNGSVTTGNYDVVKASGSFNVVAATPELVNVDASLGKIGNKLGTVQLSGTCVNPYTGIPANGTFTWDNPETILSESGTYGWTFQPSDNNHTEISGTVSVTATDKTPVDVEYNAPDNLVYNGKPQSTSGTSKNGKILSVEYRAHGSNEGYTTQAPTDAGIYDVQVTAKPKDGDTEYTSNKIEGEMNIAKAVPAGTAKIGDAKTGQKLRDVSLVNNIKDVNGKTLEGTLSWNTVNGELPENVTVVKGNTYDWTFTPSGESAKNYTTLSGSVTLGEDEQDSSGEDHNAGNEPGTSAGQTNSGTNATNPNENNDNSNTGNQQSSGNQSGTNRPETGNTPSAPANGTSGGNSSGNGTSGGSTGSGVGGNSGSGNSGSTSSSGTGASGGDSGGSAFGSAAGNSGSSSENVNEPDTVPENQSDTGNSQQVSVEVTDSMISSAISDSASSGDIVLKPETESGAQKVTVSLTKSGLDNAAKEADKNLVIKTGIADVTVPAASVADLAAKNGGKVTISAESVKDSSGADTGKVSIEVAVDEKPVGKLNGGLSVSIPAEIKGNVVVDVSGSGAETAVRKSVVDDSLASAVLGGSCTIAVRDHHTNFADVASQAWYSDAVDFATSHDLFNGEEVTKFAPDNNMTRSMLATVLWRLENELTVSGGDTFADVNGDSWYSKGVAWAADQGIVTGYGDNCFGPADNVSREQLATMFYRYAKKAGVDTSVTGELDQFTDGSSVSGYAADAMKWAVGCGLVSGKGNGILDPSGDASRAEVAAIMQRMITLLV